MQRLNYITSDEWWDTDINILKDLVNYYKLYVYVLSPAPQRSKFPLKEVDGCKYFYNCNYHFRKRNPLSIVFMFVYFVKVLCAANKSDVVNFCMYGWHPALRPFFLYLFPRKNTILSAHNYKAHEGLKNDPATAFYKRFKHFHFHSKMQMELYLKDFPHGSVFYTHMLPKDFGKPEGHFELEKKGRKVLLFFGLIRKYKRLDLLIEAVNQLDGDDYIVLIAGYCNNFSEYLSLIKNKERFQFEIRLIDNKEIPDLFTIADFLILPYDDATQSGPSLIALNYGLPIIASNLPAFEKLITSGENGFLFEKGSASSLSNILKAVFSLSCSEIQTLKNNQKKLKAVYARDNQPHVKFAEYINSCVIN